jgi:hypothetical protein
LPFMKVMMRTFQLVGMQKKPATRMVLNIEQKCMLSSIGRSFWGQG